MDKLSDLSRRDVIDIRDGRRLGFVEDVEFDVEDGRITAIVVPGPSRWFGLFGRDRDLVVPWERIVKIGADVILVDTGEYRRGRRSRRREEEDDELAFP